MRSSLRLPTKREVQYFREQRLLTHLHEQLVEQIHVNPEDWQLHFQLGNLLAFNRESFYKDHHIDIAKAELHYQRSLTLLRQLHEQDYILYQTNLNIRFPSNLNTPLSPFEFNTPCSEEKSAQPKFPSVTPRLISMTSDESKKKKKKKSHKKTHSKDHITNLSININETQKKRRKRASLREHQLETQTTPYEHKKGEKAATRKYEEAALQHKIKKRKLMIVFRNDDNEVSNEIRCLYSSPMSAEEIQRERERKHEKKKAKRKKSKGKRYRQYMVAIKRLNHGAKHRKRPSIIMMFTPSSPPKNGRVRVRTDVHSPTLQSMSLIQSESEAVAEAVAEEYIVPHEIIKGYTECFFGYGKFLVLNRRTKEGIHNLLECASWYDDSLVDPSCLTSLVLPPQFLFEDSVKKRHCINFRTLTKYIAKILSDDQRILDKQFKEIHMTRFIAQYDQYWETFHDDIDDIHDIDDDDDAEIVSMSPTSSNGALDDSLRPPRVPRLRLAIDGDTLHCNDDHFDMQSDASISPRLLSPMVSPLDSHDMYDKHKKNVISYQVYPQHVQDLVTEYQQLCASYHRLGMLLTDFLRYSDAKRQFNRALMIFKKLKIKPPLYDEIVSEIRTSQMYSSQSPSSKDRAQYLAKRHCTPGSRSNIRPLSPSFEFSFSDRFAIAAK